MSTPEHASAHRHPESDAPFAVPTRRKGQLIRYSSRALQEFTDNLPKSVVPIVLTILGTIAFQSSAFVVRFLAQEGQIKRQIDYERQRDIHLTQNEAMVTHAVLDIKIEKYLPLITDVALSLPKADAAKRRSYASQLRSAINQTNSDVGTLEGFVGTESTLPPQWLPAQMEFLSAELELLQGELDCVERVVAGHPTEYSCAKAVQPHAPRMNRALARTRTAFQSAQANKSLHQAEARLRWEQQTHDVRIAYVKLAASLCGVMICVWAYGKLFSQFLEKQKDLS